MAMLGDQHELRTDINATPLIDVLLVLLIVVMVIMPVMLRMETLDVPRDLDDQGCSGDVPVDLLVGVLASGDIELRAGNRAPRVVPGSQLLAAIQQYGSAMRNKYVHVDFEQGVPWQEVVRTMDTIRSLSTDPDHNEMQVALMMPSYLH